MDEFNKTQMINLSQILLELDESVKKVKEASDSFVKSLQESNQVLKNYLKK